MRIFNVPLVFAVLILILNPPELPAEIINVPDDFNRIQLAIEEAGNSDTVLVEPGEYVENIDFLGKNIVVASLYLTTGDEDRISETIIDGDENGTVVSFLNRESDEAALIGFTIRNGRAGSGGGIICDNANPTIDNCIVRDNLADQQLGWGFGGGLYCINSLAAISNCVFTANSADDAGGAISVRSLVTITGCEVFDNEAGLDGGGIWFGGELADLSLASHCLIYDNFAGNPDDGIGGGGVAFNHCDVRLLNCTVVNNESRIDGRGGLAVWEGNPEINNCIVWDNDGSLYVWDDGGGGGVGEFVVAFSDVQGGAEGEDNIDEDPSFENPDDDDFHLAEDSPCIDTGDPASPLDPDGTRADIGMFFFDQGDSPEILIEPESIEAEGSSEHVINIANEGNARLWWRTDVDAEWINRDPEGGIVQPGEDIDLFIIIEAEDLEPGIYRERLVIRTNDAERLMIIVPVTLRVIRRLEVRLNRRWNMISINIVPQEEFWRREEGPDVVLMTEQLRYNNGEDHYIQIMKNERGEFYSPVWGFNGIPYWNLEQGYQVKIDPDIEDEFVVAEWTGVPIPPDADIHIAPGWHIIPYYPDYELDASAPEFYVLSPIIDFVVRAANAQGQFMAPAWNFSNMDPWRETQGYQIGIDADEPVILNYPPEREEAAFVDAVYKTKAGHWVAPHATCENMSVLVTLSSIPPFPRGDQGGIKTGDQIAAYSTDDRLVGLGTVDEDGRCGIAVWGDDPTTDEVDGLLAGEAFILRLWDSDCAVECELNCATIQAGGGLSYETDGFTVLEVAIEPVIPQAYYLSECYPNPFNSVTRLSYDVPEASQVSIRVYDAAGRRVVSLFDGEQTAGYHAVAWNGQGAAAGVYLIQMESTDFSAVRKVVLVK